MSQQILITGNPVDGFFYCGPFANAMAAAEYGERNQDGMDWWVAPLEHSEVALEGAMGLVEALRAIAHQRDYHAEHGAYDVTKPRPDPDQGFDDWAADIAVTVLAQVIP